MPAAYRLAAEAGAGKGLRVTPPLLLILAAVASAHPGGASSAAEPNGGMPGQRVEVAVAADHLRVDYFAEIAAMRLYKEARAEQAEGPDWAAGRAEALRPGVRVRVDGAEVALGAVAVEAAATLKESGFVELHVAGEAPLPPGAREVEVRMENFPDEASYYAASVRLAGGLVVTGTNLGHVAAGRLRDNLHGAWRRTDDARVTTFALRPTHPWEDHAEGPLPERLEGIVGLDRRVSWLAGAVLTGVASLATWSLVRGFRSWRRRRGATRSAEPTGPRSP